MSYDDCNNIKFILCVLIFFTYTLLENDSPLGCLGFAECEISGPPGKEYLRRDLPESTR